MKKTVYTISITIVILFIIFCSLNKMHESKEITQQTAIETVKTKLDKNSKEVITNLDNPKVEEVTFYTPPSIAYFEEKNSIVGKNLYKITFTTTDNLLGPMVFYVDKSNGKLIGTDFRF